jgi:hypothetical protein
MVQGLRVDFTAHSNQRNTNSFPNGPLHGMEERALERSGHLGYRTSCGQPLCLSIKPIILGPIQDSVQFIQKHLIYFILGFVLRSRKLVP